MINDGQDDALQTDSMDWVEENYRAIKGHFVCICCDEDVQELVGDPTEKKAEFECRECATQRVKDDLYEAIYN